MSTSAGFYKNQAVLSEDKTLFFLDPKSVSPDFVRKDSAETNDKYLFVRLEEGMRVSTSTTADAAPINPDVTTFREISNVAWRNNPVEFFAGDSSHPVTTDPGRILACASVIPDTLRSRAKALPTHHFATNWMLQNATIHPRLSITSALYDSPSYESGETAGHERLICTGPFVYALTADSDGNEAMRILMTIESEAAVVYRESNDGTDIRYTDAGNGVVFLANKDHPWVIAEIHELGVVMVSEDGGDIGRTKRALYINRGVMSVVYEGDPGGILINEDRTAGNLIGTTASQINDATASIHNNHLGNGSIRVGSRRVFIRDWNFISGADIALDHTVKVFNRTGATENVLIPNAATTEGVLFGNPTTKTYINKPDIENFLRLDFAGRTVFPGTTDSLLVIYGFNDLLAKTLSKDNQERFTSEMTEGAIGFDTTTSVSSLPTNYSISLVGNFKVAPFDPHFPEHFSISDLDVNSPFNAKKLNIGNGVGKIPFQTTTMPNGAVNLTTVHNGFTFIANEETVMYDVVTLCAYTKKLETSTLDPLTTPADIAKMQPDFYYRVKVISKADSGLAVRKVSIVIESGHIWAPAVAVLPAEPRLSPLSPAVWPDPGNHPGSLTHSKISEPVQFLISYPLNYFGSVYKNGINGPADPDIAGVAGTRRLFYSISDLPDTSASRVKFMFPSSELVFPSSTTRASRALRRGDDVKVQDSPLGYAVLMWEPVFGEEIGDIPTIVRPTGYKIVRLDGRNYTRTVNMPSSLFDENSKSIGYNPYEKGLLSVEEKWDLTKQLRDEFVSDTSKKAKSLWKGRGVKPEIIVEDNTINNQHVENTLEKWGREMFRYARFIEIIKEGKTDVVPENVVEEDILTATGAPSGTKSNFDRATDIEKIVSDACIAMMTGIDEVLTNGLIPHFEPLRKLYEYYDSGSTGSKPPDVNIAYDSRNAAIATPETNDFSKEIAKWQKLRYDRTMCEDPKGVRPVWGGLTTSLDHELWRWAIVVDSAGAPIKDKNAADLFIDHAEAIGLTQLVNIAPPGTTAGAGSTSGVPDFYFGSDDLFSYFKNHHRVYGYIFYAIYVAVRYGGKTNYKTTNIEIRARSLLTDTTSADCETGKEPFPILQMLMDVLGPSSEYDRSIALYGKGSDRSYHSSLVNNAISRGASSQEISKILIPHLQSNGVRAPLADDSSSRAFPAHRCFDIYHGFSWSGGPTPGHREFNQDAISESSLCYYSAMKMMETIFYTLPEVRKGVLSGYFYNSNNVPYTALTALSHEIASSVLFRGSISIDAAIESTEIDTFGSTGEAGTAGLFSSHGTGNFPVSSSGSFFRHSFRGLVSSISNLGMSRRVKNSFESPKFSNFPPLVLLQIGSSSVPLIPGVTQSINPSSWGDNIANISTLGGLMVPMEEQTVTHSDGSVEIIGTTQSADGTTNCGTVGRWLDYISLYMLKDSDKRDLIRWVRLLSPALLYPIRPLVKAATTVADPVNVEDCIETVPSYYHRIRPADDLETSAGAEQIYNFLSTKTTEEKAWASVFPKKSFYIDDDSKLVENYVYQSSYYDVVTWFRTMAPRVPAPSPDVTFNTFYPAGTPIPKKALFQPSSQ